MRFLRVEVKEGQSGIWYYGGKNNYMEAGAGTVLTVIADDNTYYPISVYNLSVWVAPSYESNSFRIVEEFTTDISEVITEKVEVEVPVEVSKLITLKEVIGQDVETITFKRS